MAEITSLMSIGEELAIPLRFTQLILIDRRPIKRQ
jgi:hypothetical protein